MYAKKTTSISRRIKLLATNELLRSVVIAVVLIIVAIGIGGENNKIVPVSTGPLSHYTHETSNHLRFLVNWDGPLYLAIAQHGYTAASQTNFFPLYPLLVHFAHYIFSSMIYSGLVVSWLCLIGSIYFYIKVFKKLYDIHANSEAIRAVLFFVLFPTSIFLIATYTESLFAFLSLAGFYYALQKRWLLASLFAFFATMTHVTGLFLIVFLALILFEEGVKLWKIAAGAVLSSLGLVLYMIFLESKFHDPLQFIHAQKAHSWLNFSIVHIVGEFATLNGMFLILLLISAVYWWKRRKSFSIYSLLYVAIVFLGGKDLSGVGRYSLMAFPLQIMFFDFLRNKRTLYTVAIAFTSIMWAFVALRYMGGYTGG